MYHQAHSSHGCAPLWAQNNIARRVCRRRVEARPLSKSSRTKAGTLGTREDNGSSSGSKSSSEDNTNRGQYSILGSDKPEATLGIELSSHSHSSICTVDHSLLAL